MTVLNIKTEGTLLYSLIKVKELIEVAKENKINALAIADTNMYSAIEFYELCKKNDINPIIGLEIVIDKKIILYCKNYKGYQNLLKLTTLKSERNLKLEDLAKLEEGLICVLPYESKSLYNTLNKIF